MSDSGYVEIQNHSYDMHSLKSRKGVLPKAGESDEAYKSILTEDVVKAQALLENATGKKPTCFVYPFGAKNDLTEKLIKEMGFSCTLTCTEKPNIITKIPTASTSWDDTAVTAKSQCKIFLSELKCSHNIIRQIFQPWRFLQKPRTKL